MNLKTFRKEKNLNQIEMGKILNLNQQAYSRLENKNTPLGINYALKLAKHFNLSLDEIYEITPTEKAEGIGNHALTLSDEEYDWIEIYSELLRIMGEDYVQTLKKMLQAIIDKNGKLSQ